MQDIRIRTATPEDLDLLYQFEQGVIAAERPFDPTLKSDPVHYYNLQEMIAAAHIELVVAETGNTIVGSGYARIEQSKPYLQHEQYAYLGFMYVMPEYRGRGINQQIIAVLKKWVLAQNITEIQLDVYFNNINAIKAYEKAGFSKHMVSMRLNAGA